MTFWVDGVDALYEILDGLTVTDDISTRTYLAQGLPADVAAEVADKVLLRIYRAGWSNDVAEADGQDHVGVDIYAATRTLAIDTAHTIETFLLGNYFDTAAGFVDDVTIGTRFRDVEVPTDFWAQATQSFRVESRPE